MARRTADSAPPRTPIAEPFEVAPRSAAQARVIAAALELFAEHGVAGTSLQMIATAMGVTKAAVYHQFPSKDEIVEAVAEVHLERLAAAIDRAEAETDHTSALDVLLTEIVDLAVERRRLVYTLQGDPTIVRYVAEHAPFRALMERMYRVLTGGNPEADARVLAALLSAGIGGAVMHPLVADLDDDALRTHLLTVVRRLASGR